MYTLCIEVEIGKDQFGGSGDHSVAAALTKEMVSGVLGELPGLAVMSAAWGSNRIAVQYRPDGDDGLDAKHMKRIHKKLGRNPVKTLNDKRKTVKESEKTIRKVTGKILGWEYPVVLRVFARTDHGDIEYADWPKVVFGKQQGESMEKVLKSIEESSDGLMGMKKEIDKAIDGIVDEVETFLTDECFEGRKTRSMHAELTRYAVSTLKKKLDDADFAVQDDE